MLIKSLGFYLNKERLFECDKFKKPRLQYFSIKHVSHLYIWSQFELFLLHDEYNSKQTIDQRCLFLAQTCRKALPYEICLSQVTNAIHGYTS